MPGNEDNILYTCVDVYTYTLYNITRCHICAYTCINLEDPFAHAVMDFGPSPGDSNARTDTPHGDLRRSTPVVKQLKLDLLQVKGDSVQP